MRVSVFSFMFEDEKAQLHLKIAEGLQCWTGVEAHVSESPVFETYGLRCENTLFHGAVFRDFCPKTGCFKKQSSLQHAL